MMWWIQTGNNEVGETEENAENAQAHCVNHRNII